MTIKVGVQSKVDRDQYVYSVLTGCQFVINNRQGANIRIQGPQSLILTYAKQTNAYTLHASDTQGILIDETVLDKSHVPIELGNTIRIGDELVLQRVLFGFSVTCLSCHVTLDHALLPMIAQNKRSVHYTPKPRVGYTLDEMTRQVPVFHETEIANSNSLVGLVLGNIGLITSLVLAITMNRGLVISLIMASLSIVTMTGNLYLVRRKRRIAQEKSSQSQKAYELSLVTLQQEIDAYHQKERFKLEHAYPSVDILSQQEFLFGGRLYERQYGDEDFLMVRIGHSKASSSLQLSYAVEQSPMTAYQEEIYHNYVKPNRFVKGIPYTLNLRRESIAVIGQERLRLVKQLLLQLCYWQSYHDVKLLIFGNTNDLDLLRYFQVLGHFKCDPIHCTGFIESGHESERVLNQLFEWCQGQDGVKYHLVFVVLSTDFDFDHPLFSLNLEYLTLLTVRDKLDHLPQIVRTIISANVSEIKVLSRQGIASNDSVHYDNEIEDLAYLKIVQHIAKFTHQSTKRVELPSRVGLYELFETQSISPESISLRWQSAKPYQSLATPIGFRANHQILNWDLHERQHGAHALVGGTTGSGKSEFLVTYLVSMAISFPPALFSFLIIDWKGGGIAIQLEGLPHFQGAVTNLNVANTQRVLSAIRAEIKKRQQTFIDVGVNDINGYHRYYSAHRHKLALPHLMIVSDEFAELKANVPEFLAELTSVARVGRSLGIHLVLATQKPTGVVNDQIDANTRSKIAFKMQSKQDSIELIKTAEASRIKAVGRAYLRVGQDEAFEYFQSAYANTPVVQKAEPKRIWLLSGHASRKLVWESSEDDSPTHLETQREVVIQSICRLVKEQALPIPEKVWLPELPEMILCDDNAGCQASIKIGLLDLPSQQVQVPMLYELEGQSHVLIIGDVASGKTNLLMTMVGQACRQSSIVDLQVWLIDLNLSKLGQLTSFPQVQTHVRLDEMAELSQVLDQLIDLISEREQDYRAFGQVDKSRIVIVIDHYDSLQDDYQIRDRIDKLIRICLQKGQQLKLTLWLTALRTNSLRMALVGSFPHKFLLPLSQTDDASYLLGRSHFQSIVTPGRVQYKSSNSQVHCFQAYYFPV